VLGGRLSLHSSACRRVSTGTGGEAGGLLADTGGDPDLSVIASPYEPPSLDYAVEAELQVVKYTSPPPGRLPANGFGLFSRADASHEYRGGVIDSGRTAGIRATNVMDATRAFNPGTGWHVYRLETKGTSVRLRH
jgi:hypothetical protein